MEKDIGPDLSKACISANEILVTSSFITTFPFSIYKVIGEMTDIEIKPFNSINGDKLGAREIVGSDDAGLFELDGQYLMFYNEKKLKSRLRFSAGHELGHYVLSHDIELMSTYRQTKNPDFDSLYSKYEIESNMFSAQLLMPEQVIIELSKRGCYIDENFLINKFDVSKEAAEKRLQTLHKVYNWYFFRQIKNQYTLSYDEIIIDKFKYFIDEVSPMKHTYEFDLEKDLAMEQKRQSWQ